MKLIFILSLLFFSLGAHAQTEAALSDAKVDAMMKEAFEAGARSLPKYLLKQGIDQFAGISLPQLLKEIPSVRVNFHFDDRIMGVGPKGDLREGASNFSNSKEVNISYKTFEHFKTDLNWICLIALHEYLGALNYADDDYHISFSMYLTPFFEKESDQKDFIKRIEPQTFYASSEGGGASGVGKGGDVMILIIKMSIFNQAQRNPDLFKGSIVDFALALNRMIFEADPSPAEAPNLCEAQLVRYLPKTNTIFFNKKALDAITTRDLKTGEFPCPDQIRNMVKTTIDIVNQSE